MEKNEEYVEGVCDSLSKEIKISIKDGPFPKGGFNYKGPDGDCFVVVPSAFIKDGKEQICELKFYADCMEARRQLVGVVLVSYCKKDNGFEIMFYIFNPAFTLSNLGYFPANLRLEAIQHKMCGWYVYPPSYKAGVFLRPSYRLFLYNFMDRVALHLCENEDLSNFKYI